MNRFTGAFFAASMCAVVLYSETQNISSGDGNVRGLQLCAAWIVSGALFAALERFCTQKAGLPRVLTLFSIYALSPLLMSICTFGGAKGFTYALSLALPSGLVHMIIHGAGAGIKKIKGES